MLAETGEWGVATIHAMSDNDLEFSEDLFRKHLKHVAGVRGLEVKTVREVLSEARG